MDGKGAVPINASPQLGNDSGFSYMDTEVHSTPEYDTPSGSCNKIIGRPSHILNNNLQALESRGFSIGMSSKTLQQQLKQQTAVIIDQNGKAPLRTISNINEGTPKKRKNLDGAATPAIEDDVLSNNRFALLASLDIQQINNDNGNDKIISSSKSNIKETTKSQIKSPAGVSNISTQNNNMTSHTVNASNRFCPPIMLYNVDIKSLANQLKVNFPDIVIKIINKSKYLSKLYIQDYDAYLQFLALLKEKGISAHTFTPAQNKQLSLIIRGLHHLMSASEIKEELDVLAPGVVATVNDFSTPYLRNNNMKSNLFRVTLLPGKILKDINFVHYIAFQKIGWEKPKDASKQMQCKKCQRWGHIAKNCFHNYQCVKCNEKHEPGQCSLIKANDTTPFCINCKQFGHPANFKGCDIYKKFVTAKLNNTAKRAPLKVNTRTSGVIAGKSFASLFMNKNATSRSTASNSKLISDFLAIAKELFESETITIEQRIENFISNFKSMSTDNKKAECLKILDLLNNEQP